MEVKSILFDLLLLLFFVFLNALFVAGEFAIVKIRKTQLDPEAGKRSKLAIKLVTNLDSYLAATQFGITIASLGLGWIGEPVTSRILEPFFKFLGISDPATVRTFSMGVGFAFITFLHIIIGELALSRLQFDIKIYHSVCCMAAEFVLYDLQACNMAA